VSRWSFRGGVFGGCNQASLMQPVQELLARICERGRLVSVSALNKRRQSLLELHGSRRLVQTDVVRRQGTGSTDVYEQHTCTSSTHMYEQQEL